MKNAAKYKAGLIGYGALGEQVREFLMQEGRYGIDDFIYFDDVMYSADPEVSEPFEGWKDPHYSHLEFFVTLGYKHLSVRSTIIDQLTVSGLKVGSMVHSSSFINPTAILGKGVFIYPLCNVDQRVQIKDGCILNNSVTISHDSILGKANFLAPGSIFSGYVTTGEQCFFGTGTKVSNGVVIGNRVKAAIGSVITRNMADDVAVAGNPARRVKRLGIN